MVGGGSVVEEAIEESKPAGPTAGDVFVQVQKYIKKHSDMTKSIGKIFLFRLQDPQSTWTLDLKNGQVTQGEVGKADCSLELSNENFVGLATGAADPMKLYMDGLLKIGGDIMASQKLDFLKKR